MMTLYTTPVIYLWFDRAARVLAVPRGSAHPEDELHESSHEAEHAVVLKSVQ